MPDLIKLRDAVDAMVKALVHDSDAVVVELHRGEDEHVLHVVTSELDIGMVVGKQGRTVKALRVLVQAASRKIGRLVTLDVSIVHIEPHIDLTPIQQAIAV